jgi:hypothetical protein
MKKTVIVFNTFGEGPIFYYVADGDLSRFEGVYLNADHDVALEQELEGVLYDEAGEEKFNPRFDFPKEVFYENAIDDVFIIETGFIS